MNENITLPHSLNTVIDSENTDFCIKSGRTIPLIWIIFIIIFGTIWTTFSGFFGFAILYPIFYGEPGIFTSIFGSVYSIFIIIPAIIISILFLIGIGILSGGIRSLFKKGCYFVSTPTRLIKYQNNTIKSIDWGLILSDIEIKGDNKKGSIVLKMKENINISDIPEDYNPETLNITDIPNLYEIEQICRKRIKENMHL